MPDDGWVTDARDSYDRVAFPYAELTRGALDRLPFERSALALFAQRVLDAGGGPVVDAGCGPGWLTGHLARQGLDITGVDVSTGFLDIARANQPELTFSAGSITRLPFGDEALAGLVCWFVLHHVPDRDLPDVLAEFHRVLAPGGQLLVGGHTGEGSYLKTEGYGGIPMKVLFTRRTNASLGGLLRDAGFAVDALIALDPDAPSSSGIVFARRPAGP